MITADQILCTFPQRINFHSDEFSVPRPTSKVEDHIFLALHYCLIDVCSASFYTK